MENKKKEDLEKKFDAEENSYKKLRQEVWVVKPKRS